MNKIVPGIIIGIIIVIIIGIGSGSLSDSNIAESDEIVSESPQTEVSDSEETEGKDISLELSDSVSMGDG